MRVLICGYSPRTHTSYGTIIKQLWERLARTGEFEICQHAWFDIPSVGEVNWKLYPTKTSVNGNRISFDENDKYGEASFEAVLKEFNPDIVWCLSDIYMSKYIDRYKRKYGFKLIRWTLTEGEPVDRTNIPYIQEADLCVGVTKYSCDKWSEITGESYPYIYHGVDSKYFRPVSKEKKLEIRQVVTQGNVGPEDFLISYVGRNQARKRPWLPFQIVHYLSKGAWGYSADNRPILLPWDPVTKTHHSAGSGIETFVKPMPVKLWMHSVDDGTRWNYELLEQEWDIGGRLIRTAGYSDLKGLSFDDMCAIYNQSDAIHMLSGSEGFGVPIIEAAACGVPSVYTDYSGHGEIGRICKGVSVPYYGWEPAPITHVRWVYPSVADAVSAYYDIYLNRDMYQANVEKLSSYTYSIFDYDLIAIKWLKLIREVNNKQIVKSFGVKI